MTLLTVEGVFKNGKVELSEVPAGTGDPARVLVTFLPAADVRVESAPRKTEEQTDREALRQAAFARMRRGIPLGGPPYPKREELYDRFDRE